MKCTKTGILTDETSDNKCYHKDLAEYLYSNDWTEGELISGISNLLKSGDIIKEKDDAGDYYKKVTKVK